VGAPRPLALWHLASLDAPTVAVAWSLAFAWSAEVRLQVWAPVLLALMTWSVYVGDRLLDARAAWRPPELGWLRERHYFHWRHRHVLVLVAAGACVVSASIILVHMPHAALEPNSLLGAAAVAYFSGVHSLRKMPRLFAKEFLVGVIFTAGCMLPAWLGLSAAKAIGAQRDIFAVPVIYFAALAWLNCHAIADWESGTAVRVRQFAVSTLGVMHAAAGMMLAGMLTAHHWRSALLVAAGAASALLLALLDRLRERLTPLALRAAADLVLLTPVAAMLLARLRG
jgi:hypothetical protein